MRDLVSIFRDNERGMMGGDDYGFMANDDSRISRKKGRFQNTADVMAEEAEFMPAEEKDEMTGFQPDDAEEIGEVFGGE